MRLGIIGATGWLGSALGKAVLNSGLVEPQDLVLLNRSGPRPDYLGYSEPHWASDPADLVARADVIVLSVRPEDYAGLGLRAEGRLLLSFLAGTPLEVLAASGARVVRSAPNGAADRGQSYTPWIAGPDVTREDRAVVCDLLSTVGREDEVDNEAQIDYLTALSGSGAAYPALMAAAMLADARKAGLPEGVAQRAVEAAVCDGGETLRGHIGEAEETVALYRSYRGTTAAGLDAAEGAGFSKALAEALGAATEKARAISDEAKKR
ncbi:pyrroline-5-carboxylate reductase family protein [Aquibaculum arenosum]|uniref:Pyrroline-5-carboxylate reductase n=1 Tax=Aquibaculum arenosum TaxID=3032591 RepID=A0ABT5YLB3_9PROT|nr:pyrroline-5-carboxylate reductase dimerization domain-containing protein [Fodinicurvata sp. CAU 1616]MDF2095049.1 pyrroline-5-carboxylate reductase dimerization domain-containing protein [Fodinicurvata sp. CAU 1616]